jgi:phosphatidate cytidylyltransferase
MNARSARWNDLQARVSSGLLMAVPAVMAIWLGGWWFLSLVALVSAVMMWELARMNAPERPNEALTLAGLAGGSLLVIILMQAPVLLALLVLPGLAGALRPRRDLPVFLTYALVIMLTGYGLVALRFGAGMSTIIWLALVVIASDIAGYFAGRMFGGPKFWPAISPKKTWSGTVAGWFGAALVGWGFVLMGQAGWALVLLSPLVAFAGQLGDIAESWIKRRSGVKDSSNLIPGHGGVLDRFDALSGAVVMVLVLALFAQLPSIGG